MKKRIALLIVCALALGLAACGSPSDGGDSDLAYIQDKGALIIGYTVYEPMNFTDDQGVFTGFDTELATIVCEKLGVTPEFVEIIWDTKEIELNAKSLDCLWNGLTINDERKATMEISRPYVKNAQVVLTAGAFDYKGTESLKDGTIVAEQGSVGEDAIMADPFLSQASYVPKSMQTDCLMEVKAGTADAAVLDLTLAKTMTGPGTSYESLKIVDELEEEYYGVAFRKGSDACAAVDNIFADLLKDGTLQALADKYGLELAD